MRYRLTLAHAQSPGTPSRRFIDRRNVAEAEDAAKRWLRLSRNIARPGDRLYDTWLVEVPTAGESFRLIASGRADQ